SDEQSSCWVRVAHPWAGKNWGAVAIPRIGQEVIVDFLEGDPDRPIITGRVYNGVNKPPYGLPAGAAVSGLMSNSTKGGGGYNEYIMDDTKGQELIREHGQFDKDSTIEHDLREHVLHDRSREVTNNETIRIGKDRAKAVDHDETSHIKHDRTETVDHDERISIHGKRTETVDKNETLTIHGARTKTVDQDEHIQIGHDRSTHIVNNENLEISRNHNLHVAQNETIHIGYNRKASIFNNEAVGIGRDHSQTIGANQTIIVGANRTENVGGNETETVAIAKALNVGTAYQVTVGAAMNTSVGGAKLEEIGLYSMQAVGGDHKLRVKGDAVEEIGGNQQVTIQGDRKEQVKGAVSLYVGKNLILEAGESITLKVGGGYLVVDPSGVTVSNVPPGKPVVNRASPPQAKMGDNAAPQTEKPADKGEGGGFFGAVLGILGRIWALPNTLIGFVYGGVGMLFGATPVGDSQAGILRFIDMPSWMMPSAMSLGHVHLFGPDCYTQSVRTEELLHTQQAEVLGPFSLPLHAISMAASVLISTVKPPSEPGRMTHEYNLLEMGPEHGTGP
ncbi:type VI secretion system Vgr family protein, partial [Candidatus Thiosymbion oneisti]|uniref:type VI secretion system Vgr family protein n=2 Tax=Candidatus Thiosymbion oneisti TaxID=589554 RepID=UPI0013FE4CE2